MADGERELTLGERLAATRSEQGKRARLASSLSRFAHTAAPVAVSSKSGAKKRSKKGPREISSKRAVPLGRFRCLGIESEGSTRKTFDPRFEEHCGDLREEHVDRNFAFVDGLREKERAELQKVLARSPDDEHARQQLRTVNAQSSQRRADLRRKAVRAEARAAEKNAVRQGKTPFFLKKSALRERELEARFSELKAHGGVRKFIEKRRKRSAAKDRKRLPERRESGASRGAAPPTL